MLCWMLKALIHVDFQLMQLLRYVCIHTYVCAELEIAVGHWPFSDQFQDLADQN